MKKIKIGNLPPGRNEEAIDYRYKTTFPEIPNSTPECSLRTPWVHCHKALFRIDLTVVRPKDQEPQHDLALGRGKTKSILKALADFVISLQEELR